MKKVQRFFQTSCLDLRMKISIIIPTYGEEDTIGKLVSYLKKYGGDKIAEIIIADGQSTDGTIDEAIQAGANGVTAPVKGRAAQMNYGASLSVGEILYFVHADTFPPSSFAEDIIQAVKKRFDLGRYRTKFDSRKWYLKVNAWFTRFDWFICMGGDQTIFVTRSLFEKTGGYLDSMKIMEEYEFSKRARSNHNYKIFSKPALVSARKYDTNSWWRVQMANRRIVNMYKRGATQQEMIDAYKKMLNYR